MLPLSWRSPDGSNVVVFSEHAARTMTAYIQATDTANEAGGVLIGFRRLPHLEVVDVTFPRKGDVCSRISFLRRSPQHKKSVVTNWRNSGGYLDHIGEWHTHPEDRATPSHIDRAAWTAGGKNLPFLEVILGRQEAWVSVLTADGMVRLYPINDTAQQVHE